MILVLRFFCSQEEVDGFPSQTVRIEEAEIGEYFIFLDSASNASGGFYNSPDEELMRNVEMK